MGVKFAVLAPGNIANHIATAMKGVSELEPYAVASRSYERAKAFASKWGFSVIYDSYEKMLEDPMVELVYVASPHSHHYEHVKMCLLHGKNVLVEKAFTVNAQQARELVELAKENNLLLAEAIWTRYMPSRSIIDDILNSDIIGNYKMLTANLGYQLLSIERLVRPELAGGALLDVGVYTVNFALMCFGNDISEIKSSVVMTDNGVDEMNFIDIHFSDGKVAHLFSTMNAATDRRGIIYGDKGYIEVDNINNPQSICVYDLERSLVKKYDVPEQINGYEYELISCVRAIKEGKTECDQMPHAETLRVMDILDKLRNDWNFKYPDEIERVSS